MTGKRTGTIFGGSLATIAALLGGLRAEAATPEETLAARELTASGAHYILKGETDFLAKFAEIKPLYDRVGKNYAAVNAISRRDAEYRETEQARAALDAELKAMKAQVQQMQQMQTPSYGRRGMSNANPQLTAARMTEQQTQMQVNEYDRALKQAKPTLATQKDRDKAGGDFNAARTEFLEASRGLQTLGDEVAAKYSALAKDSSVKEALAALKGTKGALTLGPTTAFKKAQLQIKNAERSWSPEAASATPSTKASRKSLTKSRK